jgi:hypothetical protein
MQLQLVPDGSVSSRKASPSPARARTSVSLLGTASTHRRFLSHGHIVSTPSPPQTDRRSVPATDGVLTSDRINRQQEGQWMALTGR